jgi:hypothetical protein
MLLEISGITGYNERVKYFNESTYAKTPDIRRVGEEKGVQI